MDWFGPGGVISAIKTKNRYDFRVFLQNKASALKDTIYYLRTGPENKLREYKKGTWRGV